MLGHNPSGNEKGEKSVAAELQLQRNQGLRYTSQRYYNPTQSYETAPLMADKGSPYDNTMAENSFSILKTECI